MSWESIQYLFRQFTQNKCQTHGEGTGKVIEIHPLGTPNGCTKLRIHPIAIRYYTVICQTDHRTDQRCNPYSHAEKETPHPYTGLQRTLFSW